MGKELDQAFKAIDKIQRCICALKELTESTATILQGVATETTLQTIATEGTLLSVLAALQNGQEFEQALVVDENGDTFLQVRIWNTETHTFEPAIYYDGDGVLATPLGSLTFPNPYFLLSSIDNTLTNIASFLGTLSKDSGVVDANTLRVVEATKNTSHSITTSSTSGSVPLGFRSLSIANIGLASATVEGNSIPAGASLTLPFNPTGSYANSVSYDGTGTTLLISVIV